MTENKHRKELNLNFEVPAGLNIESHYFQIDDVYMFVDETLISINP